MMANWDLIDLRRELPNLKRKGPAHRRARRQGGAATGMKAIAAEIPGATVETIRRLGHLAHEERPDDVCGLIVRYRPRASRGSRGARINARGFFRIFEGGKR